VRRSVDLALDLDHASSPEAWREQAAALLGVEAARITEVRPRKRSIDARQRPLVRIQAEVWIDEAGPEEPPPARSYPNVERGRRVVVVGSGPAGLFAALRLIERGIRPLVLERGKDVQARRKDLARITREGVVDADSNYCFGEGGAGTYSDGKLYTRATRRGSVDEVLRILVAHGASPDIRIDAHPHIGSNKLPRIVAAMRESIRETGGEVRFGTRVVGLLREAGRVVGARTADGEEIRGEAVILATGHSARDVFAMLVAERLAIEPKPFAMGVRVEHPQPLIDRIQYRGAAGHPALPAAAYRLAHTVDGRGVFSFCMCPGGWIVPAATAPGEVVVNGMSLSRRDSPYANSGIVVSIELEDLAPSDPLAGVAAQRALETMAAGAGGGAQKAPAQRLTDFVAGRASADLPPSSYHPGLTTAPLHALLPPALATRLQAGLIQFGRTMRGFMTEEAVLVGVETRTSSPVRIPRDPEHLAHPQAPGLYPCGEGAGYAGGIVSAAMDGLRVAEAIELSFRRSG
jgi:uncharacterized FAD-dependent dehydrogenase